MEEKQVKQFTSSHTKRSDNVDLVHEMALHFKRIYHRDGVALNSGLVNLKINRKTKRKNNE